MDHKEQYNRAIQMCRDAGVPEQYIESSFVPDETETEMEVLGSIFVAFEDAKMDKEVADKIATALANLIHPDTIEIEPDVMKELVKQHLEDLPDNVDLVTK
jgi:hypothetical protein